MLKRPRFAFLGILAGLALLCAVLSVISPIRVSISFVREDRAVAAMPRMDITATAPPPTIRPQAPTATPLATTPPATAVPPTAVPLATELPTAVPSSVPSPSATPGRDRDNDPTPAPPTATVAPPAATPPEQTNVAIDKSADQAAIKHGGRLVFTIEARNTGVTTARDVVVTDAVPDAFQVLDLASSKGDIVVEGQTVTAYPAMLAPGEAITIRITAQARADAPAGQHRNTALITTSTMGDDPGDNTSTAIVTIETRPTVKLTQPEPAPPRLPRTADPDAPAFMLIWGPWLMFAFVIVLFGVTARFGMLRTRLVTVRLVPNARRGAAAPQATPMAEELVHPTLLVEGIELDADALARRWRGGESVAALTAEIAAANPAANMLVISLAVRQIVDEQIRRK
jgi:uncharacterized repeat protein (TIGR01451 family)